MLSSQAFVPKWTKGGKLGNSYLNKVNFKNLVSLINEFY